MKEYAKGYSYADTVLIGVTCFLLSDKPAPIVVSAPVAYNKARKMYLRGVELSASTGRPPQFPGVSQGSFAPDGADIEAVERRDPRMALWVSKEVPSFPHAQGFYARNTITDIVKSADVKLLEPLVYHETRTDGSLLGFAEAEKLPVMMKEWHAVVRPAVDAQLGLYLRTSRQKSAGKLPLLKDLTQALYTLGDKQEDDFVRILLLESGPGLEQWLKTLWSDWREEAKPISEIKTKLDHLRSSLP